MKICTKCKIEKPLTEFYKKLNGKFKVSSACKPCLKSQIILARQKRTFRSKKRQYYFENNLRIQGNKCAICKNKFGDNLKPCLDHNHETGIERGILCSFCNSGLGFFFDNQQNLKNAVKYLKWHTNC